MWVSNQFTPILRWITVIYCYKILFFPLFFAISNRLLDITSVKRYREARLILEFLKIFQLLSPSYLLETYRSYKPYPPKINIEFNRPACHFFDILKQSKYFLFEKNAAISNRKNSEWRKYKISFYLNTSILFSDMCI